MFTRKFPACEKITNGNRKFEQISFVYIFPNSSDCWIKSEWDIFWNSKYRFSMYFQDAATINSFRNKIRNLMKEERATFILRRLIF